MRDRNETPSDTASPDVAIPIGLFEVVHIEPILFFKKPRNHPWLPYRTRKMMRWDPKELHRFWRRMLGENER
jgi:hypothetical protein